MIFWTFATRYDCVWGVQLDAFSAQLEELHHLELELGHLPQKWNVHWDKLELPPPEQLTVSFITMKTLESFIENVIKYYKMLL